MKTLGFTAAYALFAIVFCVGVAVTQLPSFTTFAILTAVIVVGLGAGFTLFFSDEIKSDLKPIAISIGALCVLCLVLILAYRTDSVRNLAIGSWSSEILLTDALDQTNIVGASACSELIQRDRLTAVREIANRPIFASSDCVQTSKESFKKSVLMRWDERLFAPSGHANHAQAINKLRSTFPGWVAPILFDCSIRAPSPKAKAACVELSKDYDPHVGFIEHDEFWVKRAGLSTRFRSAFSGIEGNDTLSDPLTQRLTLRHVCGRVQSETMTKNIKGGRQRMASSPRLLQR